MIRKILVFVFAITISMFLFSCNKNNNTTTAPGNITTTEFNYESWRDSDEAEDLNGDNTVDILDFEIYQEFLEFQGVYNIANYVYEGNEGIYLKGSDPRIYFTDLGTYLSQIQFTVNNGGEISVTIPDNLDEELGTYQSVIIEGMNNMTISRISPLLVALDTHVTINETVVNFTLYLTETENGYSTSYEMSLYDEQQVLRFDINKVE